MVTAVLPKPIRLALALAGLALLALAASAAPARADLRVCNQTGDQVSVALGYLSAKGWESEGWWVAPAGKCAVVFQGPLKQRFYYLYVADDIGGGSWQGVNYMCTRDENFTILGTQDCLARGYEKSGFVEVDTQNKPEWTMQLTPNPKVTAAASSENQDANAPPDDTGASGPDDAGGGTDDAGGDTGGTD
jgi:uncharacterized membrane protein